MYWAKLRVMNVLVGSVMNSKVLVRAMLSHLVLTVRMVKYDNVLQVIIVKVEQQTKPLAHPGFTPPELDPVSALNALPERMPTLLVPYLVKIAAVIPINPNPMLQNAFQ